MPTKPGVIFEVRLDNGTKGYFQFVTLDITQLNSEVIRIFSRRYAAGEQPGAEVIVDDTVQLYAHLTINIGLKREYWKRYGYRPVEDTFVRPWFRTSQDYGNPAIKVSRRWWIWELGEDQQYVGELNARQTQFDIGVVYAAKEIPEIMLTGKSSYFYPSY